MGWRGRASTLGIGRPALREHAIAIPDADRDEPFVYRAAAIFLVWVAAIGFEQSFAFDRLTGPERDYGLVVSSILAAAGTLGILFPPRIGHLIRGHPLVVMATAVASVPLLVVPAGVELAPDRLGIMIITALACAIPRRVAAVALACSLAALELCCVVLLRPLADLRASHLLSYELVVIPAYIAVAGLVGSIIGEASLVSRSLGETLRRETLRRRRLEQHVGALREAVASLLDVLPRIVACVPDLTRAERSGLLEGIARTRRRAGDVARSSITVDHDAPTTLAEDIEWLAAYQRATDPTVWTETHTTPACRSLRLDDGVRACLRVAVGRALDNACEHADADSRVLLRVAVTGESLGVLVSNSALGVETVEWGRGLRGSEQEIRRVGGSLVVSVDAATATVDWLATIPLVNCVTQECENGLGPARSGSVTGRVRGLLSAVLRAWRIATVAMVLASVFLDPEIITAHRRMSQDVIVLTLATTETVAFLARRQGEERKGAIIRGLAAILLCAFVTHGEPSPLTGWALVVTCEVLWHVGWRAYAVSVLGTVAALIVSLSVPGGQDSTRALWSEALLPLWATPIAGIVVFYLARTAEREREIETAARAAWVLTDLAIRCANAHALVQLVRLSVGSRFPVDHPVRRAVLECADRVVELCVAAPGGARSRDATLVELGETVAHRISPASCVIRDYTALPLEGANRPGRWALTPGRQASLLSLFAAAADEIASRAHTDLWGRVKLDEVLVVLSDVESDDIEVAFTAAPPPTPWIPGTALLTNVALAGGQVVDGRPEAHLVIVVPSALLSS